MSLNTMITIKVAFRNENEKEVYDHELKKVFKFEFKQSDTNPGVYYYNMIPLQTIHKASGRKSILDPADISKLYIEHYEQKKSLKELSEQYNCSKSTIKKYLRDYKNSIINTK